jgi:anti-anti-sigma factor
MESKFHITSGAIDADTHVIEPQGEIDAATMPELQDVFDELMAAGKRYLILDLDCVTFLDSRGVVGMVAVDRGLAATGGKLVTVCANPVFRRLFRLMEETTAELTVVTSRREALQAALILPT